MIEEQYTSMAEEVEAKTRKLKKVWHRLQAAQREVRDVSEEFQKEREAMLDTIRECNKQLKCGPGRAGVGRVVRGSG